MSLKEFLEFRQECPVCSNQNLSIYFASRKKQEHLWADNCYIIKTPLLDLKHQRQGDICYSFSLNDNTFWIDFNDKQGSKMDNVCPVSFIKKFIKLNTNMKIQYFYKMCELCKRYNYISTSFAFDLNDGIINDIGISTEYLGLSQKREKDYKLFRIVNDFTVQKSTIEYGFDENLSSLYTTDFDAYEEPPFYSLEIPLINFTSEEKMIERLSKLIVFS